jgi:hypothetical protein
MRDIRKDVRDQDPQKTHRRAFLAGWTDAVNGRLYETILTRKTHTNMGNLFGWIYGQQSRDFKLETWYRYRGHAIQQEEED